MKNSQLMANARVYYDYAHLRTNVYGMRDLRDPLDYVYISAETLKGGQCRYVPVDAAQIEKLILELVEALVRLRKNRAEVARRQEREVPS